MKERPEFSPGVLSCLLGYLLPGTAAFAAYLFLPLALPLPWSWATVTATVSSATFVPSVQATVMV
jgi:hypothetical protein